MRNTHRFLQRFLLFPPPRQWNVCWCCWKGWERRACVLWVGVCVSESVSGWCVSAPPPLSRCYSKLWSTRVLRSPQQLPYRCQNQQRQRSSTLREDDALLSQKRDQALAQHLTLCFKHCINKAYMPWKLLCHLPQQEKKLISMFSS